MSRWAYDCSRTGPGTLAGRFMRRFWQPVHRIEDLRPGQAKPLRIMGEDFTIYRGAGGACFLVAPRCPHRGTQLSIGWVEGDDIRCRYHGWKFTGQGQCVEQPAEREREFCAKVRMRHYPTRAYHGLVFAYLGDGEPPHFPVFPELEGDGVIETVTYRRNCNLTNVLDNMLDEAHFPFAHRRALGAFTTDMPVVTATRTDHGVALHAQRSSVAPRVTEFMMPNILRLNMLSGHSTPIPGKAVAWRVPIDDASQYNFGINHFDVAPQDRERIAEEQRQVESLPRLPFLDFTGEVLAGRSTVEEIEADLPPHNMIHNVHFEDHVVIQGQGVTTDRDHEILAATDVGIRAVRDLWNEALAAFDRDGTVRNDIDPPPTLVGGGPATALNARRLRSA